MKEKGIEEIFKSAFNNFETDVDPNVWTNVQSRISGTPSAQPSHSANGSVAGKAGAVATKLGIKTIIAIVTAVTGVSVGAYFVIKDPQSKKAASSTTIQAQQAPAQVITPQATPATNEQSQSDLRATSDVPEANKLIAEQELSQAKKQIVGSAINNAKTQSSLIVNPATPKEITANSPARTNQAPPAKQEAPANTPSMVTPHSNAAIPQAEPFVPENHTFQNDFADINNYIEDEASETKGLPNAFSPNGDGHNDLFKINTKNLKSIIVLIYDRSGKQIYEWNDLGGEWNGNLADGHPAPAGLYYYSVQAETVDGKTCIGNSMLKLTR